MSNRLRSFLIVLMSIVIVAAGLPISAMTVNADETITVTYDANGGTGTIESQTVNKGEPVTIKSNTFEFEGHAAKQYWSTEKDGGTLYDCNSTQVFDADITLYAAWDETVTVSFNANGGFGEMASITVVKGSALTLPANTFMALSEDGAVFVGWNTQADGNGTKYSNKEAIESVASSMTLYAQWKLPCEITFDKNAEDATGEMPKQIIGQAYDTPLNANAYKREGYIFLGWGTTPDSGVSFQDKQMFNWGSDKVTLYAVWAEERTITFYPNGATGEAYTQKVGKDHAANIVPCKFTREFYTFDGWTTDPAIDTSSYWDNSSVTLTDSDLKLYARWAFDSANCAKITFDKNAPDASGEMQTQFVHKTTPAVINQNAFTRENKTFKCWNTQADGNGTDYADKATSIFANDVTLYAQWADNCTVTLHSNLESGDVKYDQTVGIGVATMLDKDQFKALWEHHGIIEWYENPECTGTAYKADEAFTAAGNIELYAKWASYNVTFVDEDGTTVLQAATEWAPGEKPVYSGETPAKESTVDTTYTFSGWTPEITAVTNADQTYTATYTPSVRKYTIKFVNYNDEVLQTSEVEYGTKPSYTGETPAREKDAPYTYTFAGWDSEIVDVDGEKTYKATYTTADNYYVITYENEDGATLATYTLKYGETPFYDGETPTKEGNAQFSYKFKGWDTPEITVTGDMTYTAVYDEVVNKYDITFKNDDGSTLLTVSVPYGTKPEYTGALPSKERTQQYSYTFAGWDKKIVEVTGEATYTATFVSEVNKYKVTFVNDDANKTVLQETEVAYGDNAYYQKATPTKAPTAQFTYTFAGWDNKVTLVTDDVTYTAVYDLTVNKYKITFANEDGTVIQATEVEYGQMPAYDGDTPTKSATVEYTFTFKGWDKDISRVTGEATYTATYTAKPITKDDINYKHFTVTFESNGGSAVVSQLVADGANAFKPEEPMRERYTFGGWYIDPECTKPFSFATPITSDITIYAKWVKGNQEVAITYAVVGSGSIKWALESGEDLTFTVERNQDNDTSAQHLTGIRIDGENFYEYDVTEDKTVITLKAFELDKYTAGKHTVTIVFDDGQATFELVVEDASKPTGNTTTEAGETPTVEPTTPVITPETNNNNYLGLWIALGVVALVCICALPILIVKRRTIK